MNIQHTVSPEDDDDQPDERLEALAKREARRLRRALGGINVAEVNRLHQQVQGALGGTSVTQLSQLANAAQHVDPGFDIDRNLSVAARQMTDLVENSSVTLALRGLSGLSGTVTSIVDISKRLIPFDMLSAASEWFSRFGDASRSLSCAAVTGSGQDLESFVRNREVATLAGTLHRELLRARASLPNVDLLKVISASLEYDDYFHQIITMRRRINVGTDCAIVTAKHRARSGESAHAGLTEGRPVNLNGKAVVVRIEDGYIVDLLKQRADQIGVPPEDCARRLIDGLLAIGLRGPKDGAEEAEEVLPELYLSRVVFFDRGRYFEVTFGNCTKMFPKNKGLTYLQILTDQPCLYFSAQELISLASGLPTSPDPMRQEYMSLQEDLSIAEASGDYDHAAATREMLIDLVSSLRDTRLPDNEKNRKSVGNAIANAFNIVGQGWPQLERHLRASVRRGARLAYLPQHPPA